MPNHVKISNKYLIHLKLLHENIDDITVVQSKEHSPFGTVLPYQSLRVDKPCLTEAKSKV